MTKAPQFSLPLSGDIRRTSVSHVTFAQPFLLEGVADPFPAGTYRVEIDEELLQGVSFPAYRRVGVVMQQMTDPPQPDMPVISLSDPRQLDRVLMIDRAENALDRAGKMSAADQAEP